MKHFDKNKDGQVSYNEFCDTLLDEDYTEDMLKTKPELDARYDAAYADRAERRMLEREETGEVRKAVRSMGEVLYKRHNMKDKIFKEATHITHEPLVPCSTIRDALKQCGFEFELIDIERTVLFVMPDVDLERVNYVELFTALIACF